MTNEAIIFNRSVALMKAGILKGTGRYFSFTDDTGNTMTLEEPEAIHTFQEWKRLGYAVRRGQKAVAFIQIWKYKEPKKADDTTGTVAMTIEERSFFMKNAAFFTAEQVEPLKV